jgi:hypothetical protein
MSKQVSRLKKLGRKRDAALARLAKAYTGKDDKAIIAAMDAFTLAHMAATFEHEGGE